VAGNAKSTRGLCAQSARWRRFRKFSLPPAHLSNSLAQGFVLVSLRTRAVVFIGAARTSPPAAAYGQFRAVGGRFFGRGSLKP